MAESQKRIVVGFLLENAAEFKQDLTSIREAAEGFGAEGVKSAQELVDAFDRIELGAGKVTKKISDGRTVSDRDLAAMKQAYGLLEQQIEATFGSLEQAPADIQKAFKNAEAQIGAAVSAIRQVNIAAEDASEKFDDLGRKVDAVAGLVEETKKLPIALDRAEEMVAKFNNKLQAESDVSKGDLEAIWRSQIQLNDAIKRGEINLKDLGEEGKRRLEEVRQAAKNAEAEFVRMERATDQQAAKMKAGTGDVGAAGAAMFGTFSKAAGIVGIIIALVVSLKQNLVDLANWLGLRGDKLQGWIDGISARVQLTLRAAADTFKNLTEAGGTILDGIVSRKKELILQGLNDLQNASQKTLATFTTAASGSNAEVEALAKQLGITTAAVERSKEKLDAEAEAARRAADEAKRLAEEKKKLSTEIDAVSRSLAKETAELERQQAIAGSSEWKAVDSSGQLGAAQLQVRQLEQSVEQLRQKLAEQIATWGEDSAGAKRAAAELAEYEAMLDKARIRAEQLSEATEKYREEQERATEAAKDSQERVNDLKERHGQLTEELTKLTGATETGTAATRTWTSEVVGHVEKLEDGKTKYVIGQAAMRQASAESMAAVEAAMGKDKAAAKAKEESASATEKAATAVEQMAAKMNAVNIDALQTRVEKLNTALDAVVAKANAAVAAMEKLAKLGDDDDGDDDGISIRRTGSSKELGAGDTLGGGFKGNSLGR